MSTITETQATNTLRQPYQAPQLTVLDSADTQGKVSPGMETGLIGS